MAGKHIQLFESELGFQWCSKHVIGSFLFIVKLKQNPRIYAKAAVEWTRQIDRIFNFLFL
ncbi:hypothetical protein DLM77_11620 [Leptospira yasudae]|uniref:Uncharacterized protein n=1 Tax=Leptospira yasudae TaxID=2202201 RepID=A0ABX9M363_9LEPT|nr:hypothetical protein DLM77_11620 [Leptospira yasudae]